METHQNSNNEHSVNAKKDTTQSPKTSVAEKIKHPHTVSRMQTVSRLALILPIILFLIAVAYHFYTQHQETQAEMRQQQEQMRQMIAEQQAESAQQPESGEAGSRAMEIPEDLDLSNSYQCSYQDDEIAMSAIYADLQFSYQVDPSANRDSELATAEAEMSLDPTVQPILPNDQSTPLPDEIGSQRVILTGDCVYQWDPKTKIGTQTCGVGEYLELAQMFSGFGVVSFETLLSSLPVVSDSGSAADQERLEAFIQSCEEYTPPEDAFAIPDDVTFTAQNIDSLSGQPELEQMQSDEQNQAPQEGEGSDTTTQDLLQMMELFQGQQ